MKLFRVVGLSLLLAAGALAQNIPVNPQPDCMQNFNLFNQAGGTLNVQMDNRFTVCDTWAVVYMSVGYTGVTITFQSAVDANGTPGAFGAFTGTIISGVNPMVSLTASRLVVTGFNPWVRANVVTIGASGTLNGTFYGYKTSASAAASSGCPSPCPVVGTASSGAPPSGAPVQVAGSDGANIRTLLTDTSGRQIIIGPAAAGAAVVGNPVLQGGTDGANVRTILTDASGRQNIVGAAAEGAAQAGNPVLIGGTDGVNVRVWKIDGNRVGFMQAPTTGAVDAVSNGAMVSLSSTAAVPLNVGGYSYDGATQWNRIRQAGLNSFPLSSTLTGRNSIGTQVTERGSRWSTTSTNPPTVSVQATATIAAEAGVRHVLDKVCFSATATTAPTATPLQINIRDGASGAGTILFFFQIEVLATAAGQDVPPFCTPELNLVGTTNTAMTAEFSAAVTNVFEAVSMTGINVN